MGKKSIISELTNILTKALRHKIGSIVNQQEIYAQKYAKDAEVLFNEAKRIAFKKHFNSYDKEQIRKLLKTKLKKELEEKDFIDNKKFEIMEKEIEKALKELNLFNL